jgi:hypothetical protein
MVIWYDRVHAIMDFILNGLITCVYAPQTLVAGASGTP